MVSLNVRPTSFNYQWNLIPTCSFIFYTSSTVLVFVLSDFIHVTITGLDPQDSKKKKFLGDLGTLLPSNNHSPSVSFYRLKILSFLFWWHTVLVVHMYSNPYE